MGNLLRETPYSEITATLEVLQRFGVERKHLEVIRQDEDYAIEIARAIVNLRDPTRVARKVTGNCFEVTMDCSRTLEQMIAEARFSWVNPEITAERFPVKGAGKSKVCVELFSYPEAMTSELVLIDLAMRGLEPAPIEVGLALSRENPDLQRLSLIPMFGSVWIDPGSMRKYVPTLGGTWDGGRRLDMMLHKNYWFTPCRFLVLRKP
ncbi:MAG: hypothetical protein G01um10143_366 [Parcubacteria group bacterium Gr01-1014_3]|nr:MAG: hypothetical protein G01um10143_366 [Parcubacteria group bacterium Gr01-1014_3]